MSDIDYMTDQSHENDYDFDPKTGHHSHGKTYLMVFCALCVFTLISIIADALKASSNPYLIKAIILAAAAPKIPEPLIEQLAVGGKLVIPVGEEGGAQDLLVITKRADGSVKRETVAPVAFVPMTGEVRKKR